MFNEGGGWELVCEGCVTRVGKIENSKILLNAQMTTKKEIRYVSHSIKKEERKRSS
jgi:hypothetical protein